ncbi:MAG TPA: alpha/beta hydrolase, partial [Mycobacterium sp.]|nr:alpha/beta hydrolase [Mycobacterium sp.]
MRLLSSALLVFGLLAAAPADAAPASPDSRTIAGIWTGCSHLIGDTSDIPAARCTMLAVPVDYTNPGGAHANLAVIRIPATGQRIGSLLINPGGPGASAVNA